MKLYFAEAVIEKTPYMNEPVEFEFRTVIQAEDWNTAEQKLRRYWEDQTREYDVYYQVKSSTINAAIT